MFGEERFHALVKSLSLMPVDVIVDEIIVAIKNFVSGVKLRDDVSLLGIEFKERKIKI